MSARPHEYANAPVRLVVLAINITPTAVADRDLELVHDAVKEVLPLREHLNEQQVVFRVGPTVAAQSEMRSSPRFSSRDRHTSMVLTDSNVLIEVRRYRNFDSYRDLLRPLIAAVADHLHPDGVTAIGHRFIDEVHLPADSDLGRWFKPELLAMPRLATPAPTSWQAVVSYQFDSETVTTLRYGPVESSIVPNVDGTTTSFSAPVIALDWDSHWCPAEVPEFSTDGVLDQLAAMYDPVRNLFHDLCTDDLTERFNSGQKAAS